MPLDDVSVPSRGIRVINKETKMADEIMMIVSVPSRGIRVINCMDKTKSDL